MNADTRLQWAMVLSVCWLGLAAVAGFRLEPVVLDVFPDLQALPPHTVRHVLITCSVLLGLPLVWRAQ